MAKVKKALPPRTRSGEAITDEVAEKWADEIESDRPIRWARRLPVGRPSLDGDGISPKVSFRVPSGLYDELQARANQERRTCSDITREALEKYLAG
jgi:Ribbon-helix-helix protein, copG family